VGLLTVGTMASVEPPGVIGYVEDTGPGIAPEVLEKIFQPYFTTKQKGQGTGLGLTFVRSIIEAHHGHVRVRPASHRGVRFEFFLPAKPVPSP
jgi:two-component system, cell cycle sensor histidine kinase and response regulator CckA